MLDAYRQSAIVAHLLAQEASVKLGPAGVRGGVRCGMVNSAVAEADALVWDPDLCDWRAALLVRTMHLEVLAKARRVRAAAGHFQLLGPQYLLQQFSRAMH